MPFPTPPRPCRVLIAAPIGEIGGQANAAREIASGFAADDDLTVELVSSAPQLPGPLGWLTRTKGVRSLVRPLLYTARLLREGRSADVFHVFCAAHTAFFFGAVPAICVARLYRKPVVLNYHDGRAAAHYRAWGPVVRWAIRRSALLVLPSTFLQELFRSWGHDGVVVPNAVDTSAFRFAPEEPVRPRLISTRLLEGLYAVENTIRAFALVRQEVPDATLDLYGAGTAEAGLRREADAVGAQGIRFHGGVPHADMPAVYAAGGLLVNSSRIDNMPLCIIEALAAGVPIVSTPAGGIPHIVRHDETALLVPFDQPRAMADAILRVLREPGLATRLTTTGRSQVDRYTWTAAAAGWRAVYARATGRGHAIPVAAGHDRPIEAA